MRSTPRQSPIPTVDRNEYSHADLSTQLIAADRPDLVASLASLMSTTGDHSVGQTTLDDLTVLMPRPDADRDTAIAADVALHRLIGSPGTARPGRRGRPGQRRWGAVNGELRSSRPPRLCPQFSGRVSPGRTRWC
jgi:hypothetical protein